MQIACLISLYTDMVPSVGRDLSLPGGAPATDVSYVFSQTLNGPPIFVLDRVDNDVSCHWNPEYLGPKTHTLLVGLATVNEVDWTEFDRFGNESDPKTMLDMASGGRGRVVAEADSATGKVHLNIEEECTTFRRVGRGQVGATAVWVSQGQSETASLRCCCPAGFRGWASA
jgi:hypothetical protein